MIEQGLLDLAVQVAAGLIVGIVLHWLKSRMR